MPAETTLDAPGATAPAALPAALEAFAYPAPAMLTKGGEGADLVLAAELYPFQKTAQ